jgi:hypothetical protein
LFYLTADCKRIWIRPDQERPERPKHATQDKKNVMTITWNPLGFHVLAALPKGRTFDAKYCHDNGLTALVSIHPKVGGRKLVIHADNATAHTAQKRIACSAENRLRLATRTPYSPDLDGFFLFGHVKHCLQEMAFASHEELLTAIGEIVTDSRKSPCTVCSTT